MFSLQTVLLLVPSLLSILSPSTEAKRPNIVLMIADDLGIGDIGCFGNTTVKTPNIDRIAKEGAKLTQHLAASSLCTPSRAAFLTGRYPIRTGMASRNFYRVSLFVAAPGGLPNNETTYAEVAKAAGYKTALIGKWHLGWSKNSLDDFVHHPNNQGFDYFYGYPLTNMKDFGDDPRESLLLSIFPLWHYQLATMVILLIITTGSLYRINMIGLIPFLFLVTLGFLFVFSIHYVCIMRYKDFNSLLYRNMDLVEQPIELPTLTRRLAVEGVEYLEDRTKDQDPFLLLMSWTHMHTFLDTADKFKGRNKHGRYGDALEELDWGVGEILNALDRLNMVDNTLVYFTSDNGGHLEERSADGHVHGGYNGIYKGGKAHGAVDGGIRMPSVIRYPPSILPGSVIDEQTSMMDIFPTISKLIEAKQDNDIQIDGRDILPLLSSKENISPHDFMFHYCGDEIHAIRYRPRDGLSTWKLVLKSPDYVSGQQVCLFVCSCKGAIVNDPPLLHDMTSDPSEKKPVDITKYQHIVNTMLKAMEDHQVTILPVDYQLDVSKQLWRPWLQPCCGTFPSCHCVDQKYHGKFI